MKRHSLKPSEKEKIIELFSSYLLDKRKEVAAAYLFGSFNSSDSFSDIDLGILMETVIAKPLSFEMKLEQHLEKIADYQVDIKVLNKAPISFCQNVIRGGKIILDRDPNFRADFEGMVLREYFDFYPFRRRYLEEVLNAPI